MSSWPYEQRLYTLDGVQMTVAELARKAGCSVSVMHQRLERKTPKEAVDMGAKGRTGRPFGTGLAGKIAAFFEANRCEELSFADMAAKFGCTQKQAATALMHLRRTRRLQWECVTVVRVAASVEEARPQG